MKIAVTALQNSLDSDIDPRFGRAKYLVIYNTVTDQYTILDNTRNKDLAHGAGTQTVQDVVQHDVRYIITGDCGPKAERALQAAKVDIIRGVNGTVEKAVHAFKAGTLTAATQ